MALSLWFVVGFGPPRLVDREIAPTARLSVGDLRRWAEYAQAPDVSARAFLVYDLYAERVLLAHDVDAALPPASLTKLMTALLVREEADLTAQVTVQAEDIVGGATMGLRPGMQLTVMDLLWGLLVPSGNDAAAALARHVAGSQPAFVERMNARAGELGLAATLFVNPHGLDAAGHVSSAQDLLRLTELLWQDARFRTMVATARIEIGGRDLINTNAWLSSDLGVVGVKTGTTTQAGECLIAAVEREGRTLFIVVLGSSDRYADAEHLLELVESRFQWLDPAAGQLSVLNRMVDADGGLVYMQSTGVAPRLLQVGPSVPAIQAYRRVDQGALSGVQRGDQVGVLEWWAGTDPVGSQTMVIR